MSAAETALMRWMNAARTQDAAPRPGRPCPLVAIGHAKSFGRPGNFEAFVAQALKRGLQLLYFAPYKQTHVLPNQENTGT
jgi:hypothetical protein